MSLSMWAVIETVASAEDMVADSDGYGDGSVAFLKSRKARRDGPILGLTTLGSFTLDCEEALEDIMDDESVAIDDLEDAIKAIGDDGPWYAAEDGLKTLNGLIQHIEAMPPAERRSLEPTLRDLRTFATQLDYAKDNGLRFYFGVAY